ncbi:MAG: TAT-variant-translocated molybdopterin oxidoreductase [Planctomycetota bacterium]|nr:TAT-variant-translocated molybdopterin oxidoreductase [Planctomycetota bacterium]
MPSVDHPPSAEPSGKAYWRSLDELADTPQFREFLHREFPAGAAEMLDSSERRNFLRIMGASLALAGFGLSGCRRWPKEQIAPFAHRPPGRVPGTTQFYATSMELAGVGSGLLITSYDGRPVKIEGNPQHPINRGATDALAQASVLEMYDPDRSRFVRRGGQRSTWGDFEAWAQPHFSALRNAGGSGLHILSEATASPSVRDMKARLSKAFPRATWHEYEPINNDHELAGSVLAFGSPYRAHHVFDRADVIVSLDSDFLLAHPAAVKNTREFVRGRRADNRDKSMNRLYVFESGYSLTGANADHRLAVRSADVAVVAARIAYRLAGQGNAKLSQALRQFTGASISTTLADSKVDELLDQLASDLAEHRGRSIVMAGPRQPAEVHLLVHLINEQLGNVGKTVSYTPLPDQPGHVASITSLAKDMAAGKVQTLVILGGNPVYNAPADLHFANRLESVKTTIHLSLYEDETSKQCTWHLLRAHYLESWGDTRAYDGTMTLGQPLIEPLFGGRSPIELLAVIIGDELTQGYDIVRRTFAQTTGVSDLGSAASGWRRALHDGFLAGSADTSQSPTVHRDDLPGHADRLWSGWSPADGKSIELVFAQDTCVYDGRFANNGWLQELPDPLTKLTWDNAVLMSPSAAKRLRLDTGDMVRLRHGVREVEAAVCVMPGQHAGSVTLALGYGRRGIGRIAEGAGFDFYPLRTTDSMGFASGASIQRIDGSYELVQTQEHHAVDSMGGKGTQERLPTIFREANLDEYKEHPEFAKHRAHIVHRLSLWEEKTLQGAEYAWGMSIDLTACTGCSACVVACQAENNIPIVGKDQVKRGREMHWIRVDRYFKGNDPETPQAVAMQPVPCMHCENAPCEQVCPVAATIHDKDGLNVMVYNRCIGTRYCSNNCPYKVRRFNYFDYQKRVPVRESGLMHVKPSYYTRPQSDVDPLLQMQFNPEVTVRSRGVMEKCTYCVQRISAAKIKAKNEWVRTKPADRPGRVTVPDDEITTACAQACPAEAIVFGDLNDPASRVGALHKHPRTYEMLEELNTKPRTKYLAKLRNPAPALAPAAGSPSHVEAPPHG